MFRPAIIRLAVSIVLLLLAAGFWFLQTYATARPEVVAANASPQLFSAARAEEVLARILGPEKPHPVSTEENARVRARIVHELAGLGLHPYVHHDFACHAPHDPGILICASVNDVIADVIPGQGRAIVLLAHYDSVPAGPGAADDESGVATVIEIARALIARKSAYNHPMMAVLTDGEEADLLGAAAFLHDPALKARVGAVINVEARGNQGPSILFQSSPGDGPLIDLYAKNTTHYATSSLDHEIYKYLPNDTDLTLFIADGFPSYNFAYVGGVADYHTSNDTRANLDPVSLQQQGDNMLGVASGLEQADFARLHGQNEIYLDILGRWLPRLPEGWAFPLAILALLLGGTRIKTSGWLWGLAITPALIVIAVGAGFALHALAAAISGMADPSYAYPAPLRIALALEIGGATLLVSRFASWRPAAAAVWLWMAVLGVAVAFFLPGLSPYFLLPALTAGILLFAASFAPKRWAEKAGTIALFVSAVVALLVWSAIGTTSETIMGLKLHPLFTISFAFALSALVPLLARWPLPGRLWGSAIAVLFVASVVAAIVQGLEPSYSTAAPQRLDVEYVQDASRAVWAINTPAPLPAAMRAVAAFSNKREQLWNSLPPLYVTPARERGFPLPTASRTANSTIGNARRVALKLQGSQNASQMYLEIPKAAKLKAIDISGWHFDVPKSWSNMDPVVLACMSRDCATAKVTLTLATQSALRFGLYEHRFGLPEFARRLVASRPAWAVQSQNGDGVTLIGNSFVAAAR
jgi:hypothetical protein